jgi:hypothetical protein
LENIDDDVNINRAWKTVRENIKISAQAGLDYHEVKKRKPLFEEGCSKLLDQSKQSKLPRLKNPNQINEDNLNNKRCEASSHFRK